MGVPSGAVKRPMAGLPGDHVAVYAAPVTDVAKTWGTNVPESFRQGEIASQMTPQSPFSPGTPIGPYDGYSRHPWTFNRQTAYNIASRPRTNEAVSFGTLTGLVESYDVAQLVIWHRIDSIRSLDYKLVPAEHVQSDVTSAVPLGLAALRKPDGRNSFKTWLARYLYDILAWDAGTLYRLRNRGGRCIGLQPVDGRTIAPLLDYWGNSPAATAPGDPEPEAYVQYVNGLPMGWLTRSDIIYEPFRPVTGSPYGRPPIESVILNANTDLRTQVYYLQYFTEGNLPAAFAASPESWSPDQIEQFQTYWDAAMYGDQSRKHQIRWMPPGSKFEWSNEREFSDSFSMYLLQKTCAAYHVVPSDLGLTQDINRSSGESQADVQHRVGDLPLMEHVEGILSAFLLDDLGLPLRFEFDRGEEQVDQLAQAEADQKYMDRAVVSASEVREMRYGLTDAKPIPRVFFTERAGPIPLNSLLAVAGPVDPQTAAPEPGSALPHQVFEDTPGVQPNPPLYGAPLAEQVYGPGAIPADATTSRGGDATPVAKEGEGAPAVGITSETGIYGYDLGRDEEPDEAAVAKEMAAFRRFERARRKSGEWRDFEFRAVEQVCGHRLNDDGRLAVRKAAGEVAVAGLAVLAADTGRVLMLQRAVCDDDPASGDLEFPGGHMEEGESPLQGAWREFAEETGCPAPSGEKTGEWTSPNGVYRGIVWTTESEASVPVRGGAVVPNPDDPDGDQAEAIMWMDPADLPGNPMVRAELAADLDVVMAALGCGPAPACCGAECCQDGGCCGGDGGCSCGAVDGLPKPEAVAKAADSKGPKGWPGWTRDLTAAARWAAVLVAALTSVIGEVQAQEIARAWLQDHPDGLPDGQGKREATEAAAAWLAAHLDAQGADLDGTCQEHVPGIIADGWMIGGTSAQAVTDDEDAAWDGWQPGDTVHAHDRAEALGLGAALGAALGASSQAAQEMAHGFVTQMARALVDGTAEGLGTPALGGAVLAALTDGDYAKRSVLGQVVIAAGAAALTYYVMRKVQRVIWQGVDDSRMCPQCLANGAGSPYRLASVPACPAHPACRCAILPA